MYKKTLYCEKISNIIYDNQNLEYACTHKIKIQSNVKEKINYRYFFYRDFFV